MNVKEYAIQQGFNFGHMTIGQCIKIAQNLKLDVGDVIIEENSLFFGTDRQAVIEDMKKAFSHNLNATNIGLTRGKSGLLGKIGQELNGTDTNAKIIEDKFVNQIVVNTLAAQVGNHGVGLCPCAGTGDSCPYTGFIKALVEFYPENELLLSRVLAILLKIGGMFRIGKKTTGCNMEGFGAGACATAAAFVEVAGGTPEQMENAMVLAISPTIAVPCTPRVLVPGLCATHIGGGILIARLASQLALQTTIPVNVPVDVMIAMAAQCHLASAKYIAPITIKYMEPFYKRRDDIEIYITQEEKNAELQRRENVIKEATEESKVFASNANPITSPFGDPVVGGSSEGVGSPTNCARIAHFLAKGDIKKVIIEMCPELYARRTMNVPGILMAAVNGCSTSDAEAYGTIMEEVNRRGIEVEIIKNPNVYVQRVYIQATEQDSFVDTYNRAGARIVLLDAKPSRVEAMEWAKKLNIVVIDD